MQLLLLRNLRVCTPIPEDFNYVFNPVSRIPRDRMYLKRLRMRQYGNKKNGYTSGDTEPLCLVAM